MRPVGEPDRVGADVDRARGGRVGELRKIDDGPLAGRQVRWRFLEERAVEGRAREPSPVENARDDRIAVGGVRPRGEGRKQERAVGGDESLGVGMDREVEKRAGAPRLTSVARETKAAEYPRQGELVRVGRVAGEHQLPEAARATEARLVEDGRRGAGGERPHERGEKDDRREPRALCPYEVREEQ